MKTKTENKASIRMRSSVASARITSWRRGLCLAVALTSLAVPFSVQAAVSENFDSLFGTSYSDQTSSGWRINSGVRSGSARSGSCARTASTGSANYLQYQGADGNGKDGGVGAVTFWYRAWRTSPQPTFKVQYSVNGGAFTDLGSSVSPTTTYTLWSNNVNNASDNIIVRIQQTAGERMLFDDAYIGDYAGSGTPPSVTTVAANATNTTTATPRGNVTDQGSAAVTNRGVCYKTSAGVAITDNKTQSGSGTGAFSVNLSSLSVNTKYYFKAYAINTAGTTLGSELSFTTLANTPSAPTVNNPTASSLDITINENSNPAATEFAIQRTSDSNYLQANGSWGASAVWQNKATWGSPKTATGLSAATTYSIRVKARNGENVETAFSSTADGTTCFDSVTGVYVNPTNEANFTLNWPAVSGASGYVVDVSTNEEFGGAGAVNLMTNPGFETGDSTGWDKFETQYSVVSTDPYDGTYHATVSATATRDLEQDVDITGDGSTEYEISYYYKGSGNVRIWATWTAGGQDSGDNLTPTTYNATANDWTKLTYNVVPRSGNNTLFYEIRSYNGSSANFDNFFVGVSGGGGGGLNCIPGYTNREVASTSLSVTGLTGGVTYYFRVTATNANCSATSSTGSVTTTSAATSPEIAVLGTNLAEIVSGDNSPAVSDGTDFQLWEASTTHDHIFTITNSGNDTLTLSGQPTLSGDAAFSRQANVGDLTLAPGQAETFTIRFTAPASPGSTFTSLVTVASDDSDEGTYTFAIKGEVAAPEIAVLGTNLSVIVSGDNSPAVADGTDFQSWAVAATHDHIFTVTNSGNGILTLSGQPSLSGDAAFSRQADVGDLTLAPGQAETFTIRFTAPSNPGGVYTSLVTVASDDTDEGTYTFAIRAEVHCFTEVTGVYASQTNAQDFTAAWSAVTGADGYLVDVSTNEAFGGGGGAATDLFISEYIEGSSNDKYIEIFNGTGGSVDLSGYALYGSMNGGSTVYSNDLSGSLANGSVAIYRNSSATNLLGSTATAAAFNGNDAIAIWKKSSSSWVDIFGCIGEDPGTSWSDGTTNTVNHTLVRRSDVTGGVTVNPASGFPTLVSEWIQYAQDNQDDLGSHTFTGGGDYIDGYYNRSVGGTSVSVTGLTGGVTYYFRVTATNANCSATSSTGTVTTVVSADIYGPLFSGFTVTNATGTTVLDRHFSGFPLFVTISDSTTGVRWTTATQPFFTITNPSNSEVVGPTTFTTTGHADRETACTATGTVPDIASSFVAGTWKVGVWAEDMNDYAGSDTFTFTAADDDDAYPNIYSVHLSSTDEGADAVGSGALLAGTGWWLTGMVNDAGSGVDTNSFPGYFLLYDFNGDLQYSNQMIMKFDDGAATVQGQIQHSALSGLSSAPAGVWTARVYVTDNDADGWTGDSLTSVSNIPFTVVYSCPAGPGTLWADPTNVFDYTANWSAVGGVSDYIINVYSNYAAADELFFSEYIEGSGYNKYLEIYNGTGSDVDLSDYVIHQFNGGSPTSSFTMTLTGTLADGDVYVIANDSASAWGGSPDLVTNSSVMAFNGDDALALSNTALNTYCDIIGQIGTDPGTEWGSGDTSTSDNTIRRKSSVTEGDTDGTDAFDPATEWDGYAQDTVSDLGSHTVSGGSGTSEWVPGFSNLLVSSSTSQSITGLVPNTPYYFEVASIGADCTGSFSAVETVYTRPVMDPTAASATADGNTLIDLAWTKHASYNVMIVHRIGSASTVPTQGAAYSVNDACGGGTVIYKGSGAALEHVVPSAATHHYAFYSYSGNYYSTGVTASASTGAFLPGEIVETFSYTNSTALTGLNGSNLWGGAWYGDTGLFTNSSGSFAEQAVYPAPTGNKLLVTPANDANVAVFRPLGRDYNEGRIYFSYIMNYQYNGPDKYAGLSFFYTNSSEKLFIGEIGSADTTLGIDSTSSSYTLTQGSGNDYIIVGYYDWGDAEAKVKAYKIGTQSVPSEEPLVWDATVSKASNTVGVINNIRLAAGEFGGGSGTPGNCYFDEVRIATNWFELVQTTPSKIIYDGFGGTDPNSLSGWAGGTGWSDTWALGGDPFVNFSSGSIDDGYSSYYIPTGEKIVMYGNADGRYVTATRTFNQTFTGGQVYFSWMQNYEFNGSGKWAGMKILDSGTEKAFIGKISGADKALGIDDSTHNITSAVVNLENGAGNDYIIVAKYDFDTRELAATSYKVTSDGNCEMVAEEPNGYWQLTTTQSVGHISSLTGVRLHIGGGTGVQIGDVYMDEVRVGTNWYEVTRQDGETNAAVMAAGPVPTLVYIGTDTVVNGLANLNHDDSDITVSDAELIDETAPLSIAVSWYDPNGVFLTNSTASITNIGSRAGRVNPNWDPALLEGSDLQAVGYDGLFDIFYGDNGDLSVTTGIDNAFSITNDASTSSTYYMTVSAEDDNQTGGTLTAPNGGDDVPIWRAITVNSNLTFYVGDDDTTGPTISDFIVGGSGSGGCSGGGLFISEVADPSDTANARFVELFNATGADIDFGSATWYLSRQANGSSWGDHQLTGIITNGDTFVIAYNATFDTEYGFAANNYDGSLITGNGDDGYFLYSGGNHSAGTLVDAYGVVDVDGTSEPWEYKDSHAVRNPDILKGTNVWTASQWTISAAAVANMHPNNHTNNCSGGGASEVTDGQILNGGYGVTVTVADAKSGVLVSNLVANYYLLWNEDSVLACSNFFLTPFTNASLGPVTMVTTGGPAFSSAVVTLGEYTGVVVAADADDDRDGDYTLNTSAAITFTVIDDDTNAPAASDFRIEDSGTTWDSRGDLILTGIVTDVSGVDTGSMYFLMYDEDEVLIWSNSFVISGNADDEYWVSSTSSGPNVDDMCGGIFTINVVAVDGDLDRGVEDTLGTTNFNALTVSVIGEGGAPPAVTNLTVADEEIVDESSLELTDEDINTGGYNLSMILTHEDGLYIGGGTPAFIMYNDFGTEIMNEPFTNIVDVVEGAYTAYYATNLALPGVAAANVDLGQYSVTWSASNQGACIAVELDSGLVTGGTNVFTVVDDDAGAPEVLNFAATGQPAGISTVSEEDAAAGFSITGLVRDVLSGIDITTAPPTYTIYNPATGLPMAGYEDVAFDSLSFGQGGATDYEAIGATGIILPGSCGVIYTVVVSVADADADRATGDQSSLTDQEVLVIQIEGETEGSLDADGLFVNKVPVEDSNSATVYDNEFVAGSWTMSFAVASTDIVIDGPNKPTFTFYDGTNGYVYGGEWDTITQDGGKIYATNAPMDPSPNTNFSLGAYRVYWSGRATGLCYASATESGNFGAAYTNIINVADDDPTYPVIIDNFSVAGGAVTGGVGFIGCDDSRTNLVAGDIAIIGMNTYTKNSPAFVNQDSFAFVATVGIPAGTEIKFTDNGWHCGALYGNEGTITWISTNCVEPGTVIIYKKYSDPYDSGSSATVNIGQLIDDPMFSVNIRNEEILAYQGDASDPTFLYALDTSITVPGVWEDCPLPTSDKAIRTSLPPGLQNGLTAVCVSNYDDVVLNTNTTAILGDRQTVLEYIGDYHNWIGHDTIVFPLDTWDFTFPELGSVGGTVTDEDILNGTWDITGQVYDVDSGLSQDSVWYMAFNTSGVAFISAGYFTNAWENPLTATQNLNISTVEEANSYENVTIGTNNYVTIAAMDVDADRGSDSLTEYLDIPFTVVDDDINPPFFDYLTWNGGTSLDTNQALAGDIAVTARVNDIQSGIAFETAPPYILVLDSDGDVAASNVFNVGSLVDGDARDSYTIVTTLLPLDSLGCGTYTAHVIIVDADVDRLDDRLTATNSVTLDMAGNSVPVTNQYITAAGIKLETLAGEVTDGMINTGGWDMAVLLSHPFSSILLDAPDDPQYQVLSAATNWLWSGSWTNGTSVSTNFYATNTVQALDPGSFDMIDTGVYEVIWWAVSEDACDPGNMGTNQMLVVDDDIVPPEWTDPVVFMTNNGITYNGNWTNVNDFTVVWPEATDADTGFEFRRVLNVDPTTNTVMGVSLGTNNVLHITDAAVGQTTNWIYAVDLDEDRPHDRLKTINTNFVTRFDNVPPDTLYIEYADKGPDASSEIALSWTALSGGGGQDSYGQPLSPWASYRIFYEIGADPSTNSPYFDVAEYANLGNVGTDSVILSNLAFGAEYHLNIAGVDQAGNVGELMLPQQVTLLAFNMTQAVTRVNTTSLVNAAHLSWTATNENGIIQRAVDLIYVDAASFTAALSNQWKHATTITNDTWAMEDSLNIPAGRTRFYRAAIGNSWMTNRNPRAASKEVWGIRPVTLYPGQNWVSLFGRPVNNTVIDLIGTNLPAGSAATSPDATKITWYARTAQSSPPWWVATQQVALVNDSGNYYWAVTEGGATWGNGVALPLHEAFVIEIPTNRSPQTIYLVGQVPTNTLSQTVQSALSSTAAGRNLISLNLPKAMHPSEMGLLTSGFKGGLAPALSDQLWKYDRANQKAPYAVWYRTTDGTWRMTHPIPFPLVPTNYFSPDDGIYMWIKNSTNSNWNLTQPLPYIEPSIRMNP